MNADVEKLKAEIEALEKRLNESHFSGLLDRKAQDHDLKKLKKLRKQLKELEKSK